MKLDFIIIGGQKCGSTYIHKTIRHHPQVDMIDEECPHLESPDFENGGLEELKDRLGRLDQSKVIGIKRPNYLAKPEVPERIYAIDPSIKIIVILRNPLERFKSAYFHQMNGGTGPVVSLNNGAKGILNNKYRENYPRSSEVLEFGYYGKYLEKYMALFPNNLLVLTFDELKKDKISLIKKCYQFLNLDDTFIPHEILENRPQKVNYSLQSTKLLALRNRFRYSYNSDKTRIFKKQQSILDKFCAKGIEKMNQIIFNSIFRNNKKPDFSPSIKEELLTRYKPDIEILENMIDRDLTSWKV
ncbi:MAG: sulfotransferase domain-containing protein [Saonia sp.]